MKYITMVTKAQNSLASTLDAAIPKQKRQISKKVNNQHITTILVKYVQSHQSKQACLKGTSKIYMKRFLRELYCSNEDYGSILDRKGWCVGAKLLSKKPIKILILRNILLIGQALFPNDVPAGRHLKPPQHNTKK